MHQPDRSVDDLIGSFNRIVTRCRYIGFYEVNGRNYYAFNNWSEYQTLRHPKKSLIPAPETTETFRQFRKVSENPRSLPKVPAHIVTVLDSVSGSVVDIVSGVVSEQKTCSPAAPSNGSKAAGRKFGEWPSEAEAREAFDKFWPLYHKKGGRTEAFEVFLRFVTPAEMGDLIQATITHAAFRAQDIRPDDPDGRKFTQGAKAWLLNRRWRDWLKHDEVAAQVATVAPVLTPAQKSAADARRKRDLLLAEMERRQAEKATQGSLLP